MAEKTRSAAHKPGPTRIHADGSYIISGGTDGTVSIYSSLRWPTQAPLWTMQLHEGAVTSVTINARKNKAITAGRDGCVKMLAFTHPNPTQTQAAATKGKFEVQQYQLCKTTGEVRFVSTDSECQRVFIAGDSLRMLTLPSGEGGSCGVTSIGLTIPHPIISLALSPCERYLAIASASRSVAVMDLPLVVEQMKAGAAQAATQTQLAFSETQVEVAGGANVLKQQGTHVLKELLSPSFSKEENAVLRMSFLQTRKDTLILGIPAVEGVRMFQILPNSTGAGGFELKSIGTIVQEALRDVVHVQLFQSSKHLYNALVGTAEGFMAHLDTIHDSKFLSKEKTSWRVRDGEGSLCQCGVDAVTGNLFFASTSGSITMLKKILPLGNLAVQKSQQATTTVAVEDDAVPLPAAPKAVAPVADLVDEDESGESEDDDESGDSEDEDRQDDGEDTTSEGSEDIDEVTRDLLSGTDVSGRRASRNREPNPYVQAEVRKQELRKMKRKLHAHNLVDQEAEESDEEDDDDEDRFYEEGGGEEEGFSDEEAEEGEDGDAVPQRRGKKHADSTSLVMPPSNAITLDYAVQPGATNPDSVTGNHYMAFNNVGAIMRTSVDSVHVVFHDMAKGTQKLTTMDSHRAVSGALSNKGAIFALRAMDKEEAVGISTNKGLEPEAKNQEIYIRHFGFNVSDDFRTTLPNEEIRCLAAGQNYVCVVTNVCLRLFTYTGLEIYAMVPPHNVVAVVGKNVTRWADNCIRDPFSDPLALVTVVGNQHFLRVWNVATRSEELGTTPLPVSVDADNCPCQLQWMGWAADGSFYTVDSFCVVRKLHSNFGTSWLPMMDRRSMEGFQAGYFWPWGVQGDHLSLCISTKDDASKTYNGPLCPSTPTLPKTLRLQLEVQLLTTTRINNLRDPKKKPMDDPQVAWVTGSLEADALKNGGSLYYTLAMDELDSTLDAAVMERYLRYCKEENWARCADLASLMQSSKLLERLLKNKGMATSRSKVETGLLIEELEKRQHFKNKRVCQLPTNSVFTAEGKQGTGAMSDQQREVMMTLLWARESQGVNEEIAQRKAKKQNAGLQAGTSLGIVEAAPTTIAAPAPISNSSLYGSKPVAPPAATIPTPVAAPVIAPVVAMKPVLKESTNLPSTKVTGVSPSNKRVGFSEPANPVTAPPVQPVAAQSPFSIAGAPAATTSNPFAQASNDAPSPTRAAVPPPKKASPVAGRKAAPPPPPPKAKGPAKVQTQLSITTVKSPPKSASTASASPQRATIPTPTEPAPVTNKLETQSQYENPFADLPPAPGTDWKVTDTPQQSQEGPTPSELLAEVEKVPAKPMQEIQFPSAVRTKEDEAKDASLVTQRGKRDRGMEDSDDEEEVPKLKIC